MWPLRREPVSLPRLLTDAAEPFRARAIADGATITVETSKAPEATADADPVRLRQVLHNLLDNALRHSGPSWPGHIVLSTERADRAVKLCVGDEGQGFPSAMLAGPRPGPSAVESARGLGLAIVAMIAAAHDGRVSLANRSSGGALVTVSLIAAPVQGSGAECPSDAVGSCARPAEAASERGAHSSPRRGAESTHPRPM